MKALRVAAHVGLLALCLVPVGRRLTEDWGSLGGLAGGLQAPAVVGAGALLIVASLFLPVAMMMFTQGSDRRIGLRDSAVAYYASQPMKYLPGGFWILPGRVMLLGRMGHEAALASGGLLFEMAVQALSGALTATVLLGSSGLATAGVRASVWAVLAGSAAAVALLLACPVWLGRSQQFPVSIREAAARLAEIPLRARLRNLVVTVLAFAVMWLATGVSFYLLLAGSALRFDAALLQTAIAVSTLAGLAGFITPFSPGGIGVREAALVALLAGVASAPDATFVAVLSRVLALAVEMGFALAAWLAIRRSQHPVLPDCPTARRVNRTFLTRGEDAQTTVGKMRIAKRRG